VSDRSDARFRARRLATLAAACGAGTCAASALGASAAPLEQVIVTAGPLAGPGISLERLPFDVQAATAADLERQQALTIAEFMDRNFSGVTINAAQSNPFQPDVSFRGFTASPLLGNPIGLSVFVDGVRINESFGDTVQWDLLPIDSIARLELLPGANPVFGLNTLGGALSLHTASGRDLPGIRADVMAGSFDRKSVVASLGGARHSFDGYISGRYYDEDGWRDFSPSRLRLLFAKGGWQSASSRLEVAYTRADNELIGNGLVPASMQSERREAVYTHPDRATPELDFLNLSGRRSWSNGLLLTANVYWRSLQVETLNGDAEFEDGDTPSNLADDAYEAENHLSGTRQRTAGATLQLSHQGAIAGHDHALTAGVSWDAGRTDFEQSDQAAGFTPDRGTTALGEPALATAVHGRNQYLGIYATDTYSVTDALAVTIAGRYNRAEVEVEDRSGEEPELNGRHTFQRFNPSLGFTYRLADGITAYANYSEGMRAPTPVELTCADPDAPCSLPVGFVADPPLDPVVAGSWEAGLRGRREALSWSLVGYTSDLTDDILFTAVGRSQGFFTNIDRTRRRGFTATVNGEVGPLDWLVSYARVDATFESTAQLFNPVASPADPSQPATIPVEPGDSFSGVPKHTFKLVADYGITPALSVALDLQAASEQRLRGDEANEHSTLPGYAVLNFRGSYQISPSLRLYLRIDNLLDRDYATLGAFNRNAFDRSGQPLDGTGPGPVEQFISPAVPRSFLLGIELHMGSNAHD
jgi:outer membrane receptor protein involved in Fe transport